MRDNITHLQVHILLDILILFHFSYVPINFMLQLIPETQKALKTISPEEEMFDSIIKKKRTIDLGSTGGLRAIYKDFLF